MNKPLKQVLRVLIGLTKASETEPSGSILAIISKGPTSSALE